MKKTYETPVVEKVEFNYEENVVASGAQSKKDIHSLCCYTWEWTKKPRQCGCKYTLV